MMLVALGLVKYVPLVVILALVRSRWESFNGGVVAASLGLFWLWVLADLFVRWLAPNHYENYREYL